MKKNCLKNKKNQLKQLLSKKSKINNGIKN